MSAAESSGCLHLGDERAPSYRPGLVLSTLKDLPEWSCAPRLPAPERYRALVADGFEILQVEEAELLTGSIPDDIPVLTQLWVERDGTFGERVARVRDAGARAVTCKPGTGFEDDAEQDRIVEIVLDAGRRCGLPVWLETHRTSITQDIWRTLRLVERHPELRFNGDFSHWYTGHELAALGIERALELLAPVLERVRYLQGRIGDPACMQVDCGEGERNRRSVEHFHALWTAAMRGFRAAAGRGDAIVLAPELLPSGAGYARRFPAADGSLHEECDRYAQARFLVRLGAECWQASAIHTHMQEETPR